MLSIPSRRSRWWHSAAGVTLGSAALLVGVALLASTTNSARAAVVPPDILAPPLKTVPVPEPPNLGEFVQNKTAAIQLGKALFWDMQVGSDGVQACASCHFAGGADNRARNQLSPGKAAGSTFEDLQPGSGAPGKQGGPNYPLTAADFPFHKLSDPNDRNSTVLSDSNDVVSSQGVFRRNFGSQPNVCSSEDECPSVADAVFNVGGKNTRRVEPRNAPTVINAIFNFRNLWDGRANNDFNGKNLWGQRDATAKVWKKPAGEALQQVQVVIPLGSLASQAAGTLGNDTVISCTGRTAVNAGQKLLQLRPLAKQYVDPTDSVLGSLASSRGDPTASGLDVTYPALIQQAFKPEWWSGSATQTADNFPLLFGLAVQLYEATLVANDSPFDQFMDAGGNSTALSADQVAGLGIFTGDGRCANCHGGAELTNASVSHVIGDRLERMTMGNGGVAVYDNGFYNIGVRPTSDDIGLGGTDPFGNPFSETGFCQRYIEQHPGEQCPIKNLEYNDVTKTWQVKDTSIAATIGPRPGESIPAGPLLPQCPAGTSSSTDTCDRRAVNGAFKTPGLRNVELTGPYFHNGGMATLRQVVDFYNRGGNFSDENLENLDPEIGPLGLTETQKNQLVAFLLSLTDERVRYERAPFDHPSLCVPDGHPGDTTSVTPNRLRPEEAADRLMCLAAVGAAGRASSDPVRGFLNLDQSQP